MDHIAKDTQAQFDLLDETLDQLEGGLPEASTEVRRGLNTWIGTTRQEGFPEIAYELEVLEGAIDKGDGRQIRESLVRLGHLTEQASSKADGMMKTKLLQLARYLLADAKVINRDDMSVNTMSQQVG